MKDQEAIESEIKEWLEVIKPVQPRNAQATQRNRARFLSQAVSASELPRHKGWKLIFRKEQFPMKVLMSLLVMASLLFGGEVTVAAAQNDLPGESLYGLKIWSEDLSLRFQNPSEEKVDRLMELARVRVQEMAQIKDAGKAVPDQVPLRLEEHVQQALEICSTMDDPAMDRTLQKLQDQLRERDQDMERLQLRVHQASEPVLERTREMLQLRLQLLDQGLHDHEMFRAAARNGFRYGQQDDFTPPGQPEPGNGQQYGPPTSVPVSPNTMPGSPTANPGGPNTTPGGPNLEPGGNMNGSGTGSAGNANDSGGNGYGGNESSGGKGGNDSGGGSGDNGYGGSGTGGGGGSGDGMGGNGNGGQGSGDGPGGGGSGGNRP